MRKSRRNHFVVPVVRILPQPDPGVRECLGRVVGGDANHDHPACERAEQQFPKNVVTAHEAAEDGDASLAARRAEVDCGRIRRGCAPLAVRLNCAFMTGAFCCAHRSAAIKGRDPITSMRQDGKAVKMPEEPILTGLWCMSALLVYPDIWTAFRHVFRRQGVVKDFARSIVGIRSSVCRGGASVPVGLGGAPRILCHRRPCFLIVERGEPCAVVVLPGAVHRVEPACRFDSMDGRCPVWPASLASLELDDRSRAGVEYVTKCLSEGCWGANEYESRKFNLADTVTVSRAVFRVIPSLDGWRHTPRAHV